MKRFDGYVKNLAFIIQCLFIIVSICEYPAFAQSKIRDYWPTDTWKTSSLESVGIDPEKFAKNVQHIEEDYPYIYSFLVIKNGYLVYEDYYKEGSVDRIAECRSVAKSFTSALIGIAIEKKYIKSIDQKIISFFPSYFTGKMDPRIKDITIKHLLTMSAGFQWEDWGNTHWEKYSTPDWLKLTIQLPLYDPGKYFKYNTTLSHILSIILSKTTNSSTFDFANENIFKPIGIKKVGWEKDPNGYNIGGFGLSLTARDLAKFGFLYLNNGYWGKDVIVPKSWVKESTKKHMDVFGFLGYGYQWWTEDVDNHSSYKAWGRGGQFIVVVPEFDLVIVVTSDNKPRGSRTLHYSTLFNLVVRSVKR